MNKDKSYAIILDIIRDGLFVVQDPDVGFDVNLTLKYDDILLQEYVKKLNNDLSDGIQKIKEKTGSHNLQASKAVAFLYLLFIESSDKVNFIGINEIKCPNPTHFIKFRNKFINFVLFKYFEYRVIDKDTTALQSVKDDVARKFITIISTVDKLSVDDDIMGKFYALESAIKDLITYYYNKSNKTDQ